MRKVGEVIDRGVTLPWGRIVLLPGDERKFRQGRWRPGSAFLAKARVLISGSTWIEYFPFNDGSG